MNQFCILECFKCLSKCKIIIISSLTGSRVNIDSRLLQYFILEAKYEPMHIRTIHKFFIETKFDLFTANIKY